MMDIFEARGPNETIFYTHATLVRHSVVVGDDLTLRTGDQEVLVHVREILGPHRYAGIIYGFEPSRVTEPNGLQLDQRIEFDDSRIFGVRQP